MDSARLLADKARLEENLRATEAFAAHRDDVAIWQLISLLLVGALNRCLHLCIEVGSDIAKLFLHITHNLPLRCGGEGIAPLCQDFHEVFSQVSTGQIQAKDGMWKGVPLVDRNRVRYA